MQDLTTLQVAEEQPYIYRLSHLGVEAQRRGKGIDFAANVSALIWGGTENWDQGNHLKDAAAKAGLDLADMEAAIQNSDHQAEVERNQQALDDAGHWGVPTMVVKGEPFFGQDRVETLRWGLEKMGLSRAIL